MTDSILDALNIGLKCALSIADYSNSVLAGYKPLGNSVADENVRKIEAAIALWKAKDGADHAD